MSNFISGGAVDCGPSTALKDVGALVERDYGVQRDRYVPQAGSSSAPNAFRARPAAGTQAPRAGNPFDVSQLRAHLPNGAAVHGSPAMHGSPVFASPSLQAHAHAAHVPAPQRWADSFPATTSAKGKGRASEPAWGAEFGQQQRSPEPPAALAPWQRAQPAFSPGMHAPGVMPQFVPQMPQMPMYAPPPPMYMPQPNKVITRNPAHDYGESVQAEPQVQPQAEKQAEPTQVKPEDRPQDELARTAQALVDQLGQEQSTNEKLQNSQFMQLLRGLGEGSVVVQEGTGAREAGQEVGDGAKFVASNGGNWASSFLGGAPAAAATATAMAQPQSTLGTEQDPYLDQFQAALTMNDGRNRVHFDPAAPMQGSMMPRDLNEAVQHRTAMPSSSATWEESLEDDEYDDYDTEALRNFNGGHIAEPEVGVSNASREDWDALQAWDDEMRTGTEEPYLFHSANPYALGSPIMRELSPTTMGVLELEAAVQQEPRDASAWIALGLKQQENEREDAAIRALAKATELDPDARGAYLALAVSYTNEGREESAHAALERWIELGPAADLPMSQTPGESSQERKARIIDSLIHIARMSPDDLDADVQVALGVLFNSSEDYHKAEDCFLAALEARPEDWVLYNRLGATLANSGRSHEAIKYYHRALALHPNFVRAQFNLGISYINLAQYRLAAQCILDAIRLQHSDVTEGYGAESAGNYTKGVTSDALWTTLRMACLHLQRPDLVTLANHHDLSGFPFEI